MKKPIKRNPNPPVKTKHEPQTAIIQPQIQGKGNPKQKLPSDEEAKIMAEVIRQMLKEKQQDKK